MIIYLDLVFLINFFIDGAILQATAWTCKYKLKWWRLVCSASFGALYAMMMFFPSLTFMYTFLIKCAFSIIMIILAFGFTRLQSFIRQLATFYFVNFIVAGGMFAFYYFFQTSNEVYNGMIFTQAGGNIFPFQISFFFLLFLFFIMLWFYRGVFKSLKSKERITNYLVDVEIVIDDYVASCKGLIDTGNQLYDPLTRTPVMVMDVIYWKDVLPDHWLRYVSQMNTEMMFDGFGSEEFKWQERMRLVPYKGISASSQFMLAVKPDKVVILQDGKRIEVQKVLVGMKEGKLCTDNSYQAIIHPSLLA
ncbi:sigma-E processing peptidase SpoIIGA [Chengkuizengella axinellae]|uniref:Sporulation sigma-E factor-processing peptidase n=1 Tax=Chengkuizengella axinellae TaxID=3064388 RepID=A0ABT9IV18_9BACL|nr:sigma-E processing peptidase SpoIIGA [Chengkuizengella sp. 2205SS18-9]MDP5273162.1 sigma-E processing peptidase SpoIIGA [Chengkuizengella sp. 2205SS18-9]